MYTTFRTAPHLYKKELARKKHVLTKPFLPTCGTATSFVVTILVGGEGGVDGAPWLV